MEYIILIYCLSLLISSLFFIGYNFDEGYTFFISICPIINTIFIFKEIIRFILHIKIPKFKLNDIKYNLKHLYEVFKK